MKRAPRRPTRGRPPSSVRGGIHVAFTSPITKRRLSDEATAIGLPLGRYVAAIMVGLDADERQRIALESLDGYCDAR